METKKIDVIAPSLGKRYSSANSSMEAVIPKQSKLTNIVGLGFNLNKEKVPQITFKQFIFGCWRGKWRIWHARRNIEKIVGLILRHIFRYKLILVSSTAGARKISAFQEFLNNNMDAIVAVSKISAERVTKETTTVYHGVDTTRFYPKDNKTNSKSIGVFGRIKKSKGVEEFIDASISVLSKNPEWKSYIYGEVKPKDKNFLEKLKNKVAKAGLNDRIIFSGFTDYFSIPKIYQNLDIVICPSYSEGFGLPCLEAMASKCGVIATKTGVWTEIIDDGINGFLIETRSADQIAARLDILINDKELLNKIAENGYNSIVDSFKIENEAEGLQKIYNHLIKQKK